MKTLPFEHRKTFGSVAVPLAIGLAARDLGGIHVRHPGLIKRDGAVLETLRLVPVKRRGSEEQA